MAVSHRLGAIDVGSNGMRLRIVDARGSHPLGWRDVVSMREAVRLGRDVFATGKLSDGAVDAAVRALSKFRSALADAGVHAFRATATAAVREAQNRSVLLKRAAREARVDLEVLDGREEARLVRHAVVSTLPSLKGRFLLVDLGGGSTEVTLLEDGRVVFDASLPLGTVRLMQATSRRALEDKVDRELAPAIAAIESGRIDGIIGTGGNLRTLARLCPSGKNRIDIPAAHRLRGRMENLTPSERAKTFDLRVDRADTIVPAMCVVTRLALALGTRSVEAPEVGLREGVVLDLAQRLLLPQAQAATRVSRRSGAGAIAESLPMTNGWPRQATRRLMQARAQQ